MFKKVVIYILMLYSISNYYEFFNWYFSENQIIVEDALILSLLSSIPMFLALVLIHIFYYPADMTDRAKVISFPPVIFLFFINLAFLVSMTNMYYFQVYDVPEELDIFRSRLIGGFLIIIALLILYFSLKEFTDVNEDPIPTSPSSLIIKNNIYSYSRNPMYLGLLILQIGIGMLLSVIHITIFTLFTYLVLKYYVIIPEEKYLEEKFGEKYLNYKISVRRWF
tara:strand:+ start:3810 stop:4478 length:669 start_codon:yes stop_codon:yes gene_type:complete